MTNNFSLNLNIFFIYAKNLGSRHIVSTYKVNNKEIDQSKVYVTNFTDVI